MAALRTAIIYRSKHHGNTKKLVDAVAAAHPGIDLIDAGALGKKELPDLSPYHLVGVASGIYYGSFDKDLMRAFSQTVRDGDHIFTLMTYGGINSGYAEAVKEICTLKQAVFMGSYGCNGYVSTGPFKLVGGLQKGHPTDAEVSLAVDFYSKLVDEYGEVLVELREKRDEKDAYEAAHPTPGIGDVLRGAADKLSGRK